MEGVHVDRIVYRIVEGTRILSEHRDEKRAQRYLNKLTECEVCGGWGVVKPKPCRKCGYRYCTERCSTERPGLCTDCAPDEGKA